MELPDLSLFFLGATSGILTYHLFVYPYAKKVVKAANEAMDECERHQKCAIETLAKYVAKASTPHNPSDQSPSE